MAASDSRPIPLKNTAYRVYFPIIDADGDLVSGAAALDSERSLDGGTFADCTNEATEIATASGMYFLDLTAAEMNTDCTVVIVKTTTTGAKTTPIVLYPQEADDIRVAVTHWVATAVATPTVNGVPEVDVTHFNGTAGTFASGRPEVNTSHVSGTAQTAGDIIGDTNDIQARLPAALVSGRIDASVGAMAANVVTAAAIATAAIDADALASDVAEKIIRSVSGTADSTTTTTVTDAERTEADTDYWKDAIIVFTAGPAIHQPRRISAFAPATDIITVDTAFTTSPGANTYIILRTSMALGAAAGTGDWTTAEKEQIRDALGVDGTKTAATGGDVQDIQGRLPTVLVSGRMDSSVGAMAAGTITAAAVATGAIDADALAADAGTEIAAAVWNEDATGHQAQGSFGQVLGDSGADTDTVWSLINANLDAAVSSRATPAQVNVEIVDALNVDTYAEPGQGAPAATATLAAKIGHLYKAFRNRKTQTATTWSLFGDDAVTVDAKSTVSDDGTTAVRGEIVSGP